MSFWSKEKLREQFQSLQEDNTNTKALVSENHVTYQVFIDICSNQARAEMHAPNLQDCCTILISPRNHVP